MQDAPQLASYNQRNQQMESRKTALRLGTLTTSRLIPVRVACLQLGSLLLALFLFPPFLFASNLGDAARQLADRIAAVSGPGAFALDVTNRSSLDDRSVRDIRSAIEAQLRVRGVATAAAEQAMGSVHVSLSESLREYVWTAEVTIGSDQPRIVLVSVPRTRSAATAGSPLPITLKKELLFAQEGPILDAALVDSNGGAIGSGTHLIVLDPGQVAVYRQQSGRWELEASLAVAHARTFPRDARGRLFLRRDHLFDAYLPGTICRSSAAAPLTMNCAASDDPWLLTPEENIGNGAAGVRAFYAPARNFFTGALSPGIGKISNVPSFYSAAPLPRSNYTLWVLAAVDGSIHLIDGMTDQAVRGGRAGSDLATVRSNCGVGTQLLVSGSGNAEHDTLRAYEVPDRDPVAVSSPLEFDGPITALWTDASQSVAMAVVKREDTGWYEANRISVACGN